MIKTAKKESWVKMKPNKSRNNKIKLTRLTSLLGLLLIAISLTFTSLAYYTYKGTVKYDFTYDKFQVVLESNDTVSEKIYPGKRIESNPKVAIKHNEMGMHVFMYIRKDLREVADFDFATTSAWEELDDTGLFEYTGKNQMMKVIFKDEDGKFSNEGEFELEELFNGFTFTDRLTELIAESEDTGMFPNYQSGDPVDGWADNSTGVAVFAQQYIGAEYPLNINGGFHKTDSNSYLEALSAAKAYFFEFDPNNS